MTWLRSGPGNGPEIPVSCLLCHAASRAEPSALIDARVALALATESDLQRYLSPSQANELMGRLLSLSEEEASYFISMFPNVLLQGCALTGKCEIGSMVQRFLTQPRLTAVPTSGVLGSRSEEHTKERHRSGEPFTLRIARFSWRHKVLLPFLIAATLATRAEATGNSGSAGGSISGYTVSGVQFEVSTGEPSTVTGVSFTLDPYPSASTVVSVLISDLKYRCAVENGRARCTPAGPSAPVSAADALVVTAGHKN